MVGLPVEFPFSNASFQLLEHLAAFCELAQAKALIGSKKCTHNGRKRTGIIAGIYGFCR